MTSVLAGRVGIFGGLFNPPHLGHLICAQEASWQLGLDTVLFMPAGMPPHRDVQADVPAEHRLRMCREAVGENPRFAVCDHEVRKAGPAFTVETLEELGRDGRLGERPVIILGGDQAFRFPTWRSPRRVLEMATLACAERGRHSRLSIADAIGAITSDADLEFFDMPAIGISSTAIRRRVAAGHPIEYLVPAGVASFIARHGLYRE